MYVESEPMFALPLQSPAVSVHLTRIPASRQRTHEDMRTKICVPVEVRWSMTEYFALYYLFIKVESCQDLCFSSRHSLSVFFSIVSLIPACLPRHLIICQ